MQETKFARVQVAPTTSTTPKPAPKMAIAGLVAKPSWRPGTKFREVAQDTAGDVIEIASSASYVPLIADIELLAQRTPVPTWRPDSG